MAEKWWEQQTPDPKLIESMAINYFSQSKEIWESFTDEQKERVRIRMRKIWDEVVFGLKVNQPSDVKPMVKLYTEEQVRESYQSGFRLAIETDGGLKECQEEFINSLTPIELPSDEEINNKGSEYVEKKWEYVQIECYESFTDGAKWLKDKILNQNK